jgi:hypothetical protein
MNPEPRLSQRGAFSTLVFVNVLVFRGQGNPGRAPAGVAVLA